MTGKSKHFYMEEISEKVLNQQRLTMADGMALYQHGDLLSIGQLANLVNERKNGNKVYFIHNLSLYFTNVCEASCGFCHYRRDANQSDAFTFTPAQMLAYVEQHYHPDIREFHITGGHNPHVPFEYYVESIRALKKNYPRIAIKAYTAAEIEFFSRRSGLSYFEVLHTLREAGLDTLTGGGAEILSERYRSKMGVGKATTQQWLDVQRVAHQMGFRTHATMLYGSIETIEERVQHLLYLRELQDETNGFMVFIPNAVQPASVQASIKRRVSAIDDLKTIAISRLLLDNFPHIKAYFINLGTQLTQVALQFGASDAHGTIYREKISHAAGALSPEGLTRDELVWLIQGAGKTPVERDTFYRELKVYDR